MTCWSIDTKRCSQVFPSPVHERHLENKTIHEAMGWKCKLELLENGSRVAPVFPQDRYTELLLVYNATVKQPGGFNIVSVKLSPPFNSVWDLFEFILKLMKVLLRIIEIYCKLVSYVLAEDDLIKSWLWRVFCEIMRFNLSRSIVRSRLI